MSSAYTEYYELLSENGNLEEMQNIIDRSGAGIFRIESFIMDVLSGEILNQLTLFDPQ